MAFAQHYSIIAVIIGTSELRIALFGPIGRNGRAMAKQPTDKEKLAQEKRDLARRARRLAQLQAEPDSVRLSQFAAELDQEAEALERSGVSVCLPPVAAPNQQVEQQVQQQQSTELPIAPQVPKDNI